MVLYVLNRAEELLTVLHNDSELDGITSLSMVEDLSELSTLDFDVSGNTDGIEHLAEETYLLTQNMAGKWKLFVTRKVTDIHGSSITKRVYAEDVISELGEYTVGTNYVGQTVDVETVLTSTLAGTGFVVGSVDKTIATVKIEQDTRYMSKLALVQLLAELADVNIFTNVTIEGTEIADVTISLTKTNKSEGKRFEFDGELDSIQRDVDTTAIKTAILPLGRAKDQTNTDAPVEYVNISEVEWFKNEGKPFDKPKGSDLLIDPEATAKYGIKDENGVMQPRVVVMQFDIDDPELLAEKAYLELDKLVNPQVNYTFSANDMSVQLAQLGIEEQPVEVGDVCYVVDNSVNPPIIQEVVIRRIAGNPDDKNGMEVEIGKPLSSFVDDNGSNSFTGVSNSSGGSGSGGGIQDGDTVNALTIINGTVTNLRVINGSVKDLTADVATVGELSATTARIDNLYVGDASFDNIIAGKADIGTVEAVDGKIDQLKTEVAYITDLTTDRITVGNLVGQYANLTELLAGNITADHIKTGTITAESGVISSIDANTITTGTLDATNINIINLNADNITTGTIDASIINVTNIDASHIGTGTLDASKITVTNLSADVIKTGTLDASKVTVTNLNAGSITTGTIDASKITVTNLNASNIKTGTLDASKVTVTNLNASNITGGTIDANKVTVSNLQGGAIVGGTIDAVKVQIINLNASNITSGSIDASRITVSNLNASNITSGTLDANRVTVANLRADSIVAGSITVQGENLIHNTEFKENLNGWSNYGGWTLDTTTKFEGVNTVKINYSGNTSAVWREFRSEAIDVTEGSSFVGSIYVKTSGLTSDEYLGVYLWGYNNSDGNRQTLSSTHVSQTYGDFKRITLTGVVPSGATKLRLAVSLKQNGTVYLAKPMLSRGTIASIWKPHTDELISDGAISNDKIADNTIQSGKLFLDEILASTAFIEKFRAVEIDANQIRVNKITSDQLDVEGIVSFTKNPSIFGRDMEWIFDTSADQTWINGGAIWANSVTADKINAKGLKVETADKVTAFQVFDKASADASSGEYLEGDVLITGTLKSSNFDPNTNMGYKITKDGDVHINNAIIRGDVLLPSAGITNFGGASGGANIATKTNSGTTGWNWAMQVGGKSITEVKEDGISCCKMVRDSVTQTGWSYIRYSNIGRSSYKANTKYTISFDVKASVATNFWCGFKEENSSNTFVTADVMTGKTVPNVWTRVHATVTTVATMPSSTAQVLYISGMSSAVGVSYIFRNLKIEEGTKNTPWCPNESDNSNFVRFWAGASYENRDEAPFQVLQDGTVKATIGEFGGTFTGKLEIGNIHIADTNTSTASIKINTNNNAQTLIELTEDTSFINTDFVLGSTSSPKFTYTKGNGSFKFSNSPVSIEGTKSFVYMPADNSPTVAIVGYNGGSYGDYSHEVKYNGGGLRFDQTGTTGSGIADFQFTKNDGSTDVNVSVQGNVQITNTIQMGGIQIINRTVGSEKRIDFVVL